MDLTCIRLGDYAVPMAPARSDRAIFDRNRHAYRCLPLSVANAAGWELLCSEGFTAVWDGGNSTESLKVLPDRPSPHFFAKSHFAYGILTFDTGWLFRTSPGYSLWAMGSPNDPKDGIHPLAGLVETYWVPYTFTMNWQFTRPGHVRFNKGEPFCFITPTQIAVIAECQPVEVTLADVPEIAADFAAWRADRDAFMERLHTRDPDAIKAAWTKHYFRGQHPTGVPGSPDHMNKLRVRPVRTPATSRALADRDGTHA